MTASVYGGSQVAVALDAAVFCSTPAKPGPREAVIGQEAHIIGERPGAARYQPLAPEERDAYENRILLCPNDHVVIDGQPERWTTKRLHELEDEHEGAMTARTADRRPDGVRFQMPQAVALDTVMTGQQLLDIVGPAYAYVFENDELDGDVERRAAKDVLGQAHDLGEMIASESPAAAGPILGRRWTSATSTCTRSTGKRCPAADRGRSSTRSPTTS